ncbi:DC-STAMP domain-containing protein 2 isoform X2 [Drosophila elegans]|uniref:DC-STAMP domain-containing protein 2 isoform X2 n=1 Tax=Drosophila elegans TaxID=30023 RepID=UPI001BC82EAE|nr:DC-STAMP domain-containing protein 2 isoform X2 [Drosophila elegans]
MNIVYKKANKRERQRRKYPNEGDEENISENSSVLQTGKGVNNSYKNCSSNTQGQLQRNSNNDLDREQNEYSKNRCQSPEGDAPIYPFNSPEDPRDPQPECNTADRGLILPSICLGNPLPYIIAGYVVGILLVLYWYYRNPQKACIDLNEKWVFAVLLFLLLLILIQRRPARCIAALCFSSLASYQFRAVIIALAFLMACSGPVRNIIHNICIMANTLYCGQNVLIRALRLMQRIINDPSHSVEESFQGVLTDIRKLVNKLDKLLIKLERPIAKIHATFKICADWLGVQRDHFDYKMGTPYDRCLKAWNLSITQCKTEFGVKTKDCCNKERFNWFCDSLKTLKTFFNDNLQWSQVVIEEIFQRLHLSFIKIRFIFISTISFDHNLKLNSTNLLVTTKDQLNEQDITRQLESQRHKFFFVFLWLDLIVFILLLAVILQSFNFWFRFLAAGNFENVYITKDFENYDKEYYQIMGERVLPLSSFEDNQYVKINSVRLLPNEFTVMYRSWTFLIITGIQLFCICFVDYSLYSMLTLMSFHGHMTADLQPPEYEKLVIKGGGKIGDILRDLIHAFEPKTFKMNTQSCLPIPGKPKYLRYLWIFLLYLLAWLMVFWEPYGRRLRHLTMVYFYPKESIRRARDLHYNILKERETVFKTRCRQARLLNAFVYDKGILSSTSWLNSRQIWWLSVCRRTIVGKCCTICSKPLTKWDNVPCDLPTCRGIYCKMCFQECNNLCILCSSRCDSEIFQGNSSDCEADTCISDINFQERDKNA